MVPPAATVMSPPGATTSICPTVAFADVVELAPVMVLVNVAASALVVGAAPGGVHAVVVFVQTRADVFVRA
jgi:hypothetical protein